MSVSDSSSTAAASARLATAMHVAAKPASDTSASTTPEVQLETARTRGHAADSHVATRDAGRGAAAAPDHTETGSNAAQDGAAQVMGQGQPGSGSTAARAASAPSPADAGAAISVSGAAAGTDTAGAGGWSPEWQQVFERLQLAPADVEYLAQSGYSDAELAQIADALSGVDPIDAGQPQPGVDAGSAASANGPTAADVAAGQSAWTPEWEQKFSDVMKRMGMSDAQISQQLSSVDTQAVSEEQLQVAYQQMEQSLGAFDDGWKTKFEKILDELDTPADERKQVLEQLAGGGLDELQLTEIYTQMQNSKPGWNEDWYHKFHSLEVPDEMIKQLEELKAPELMLQQQYGKLVETENEYRKDGRLDKLKDADATSDERWGVMLQGMKGEEFDKTVEQIHSSHVPAWKRIGSFALNLIPGVYAVQYLTGKDWMTGEKIDRSNPLNIVGAVASGFAGFTAVRSAIAGVQGLTALNAASQTTKAAAGGVALADAVSGTSALSQGSFKAIEAAGLVSKFDKGLKFTDYLKSAIPIVNRFGEAGRLSAVGRGYMQSMQLAAGSAALKTLENGRVGVDQATKATVLGELKKGNSITDALAAAGRTSGTGGGFAVKAENIIRDTSRYGFLQGSVGKLGEGGRLVRGSGNFTLNPFARTATVAETATPNVFSLGRGVNFGTNGGLAQGMGLIRGANSVANPGLAASSAAASSGANRLMSGRNASSMAGIRIADDVQRIQTMESTALWANKLGVTDGGRFRSLLQLGSSNRAARNISSIVENGGNTGYRAARQLGVAGAKYGGYAATGVIGGAAVGMTGKQMQPYWEYLKHRDEIQAQEEAQRQVAEADAAHLEQVYAAQNGGSASGGDATTNSTSSSAGASTANAGSSSTEPQVVGTSQTGGTLVYFPLDGVVVDQGNGDVYDPQTGQVIGSLAGQQQGSVPAETGGAASTGTAPTAGGTGAQEVYVDPNTGYYVDPQTGLQADPATGQVYDTNGNVVGNVNEPAA